MGFNFLGATAGLLSEVGNQASIYDQKRREDERNKLIFDIQARKEAAQMAKDEALMKYNYYREDARDARDEANRKSREDIEARRFENQSILLDRRLSAQEAAADRRASGGKESSDERKLKMINEDPTLSPEEKAEARKILYGLNKKGGSDLSESQQIRMEEKLAELKGEGITDENLPLYNVYAEKLGLPKMKKVEASPADGGILGFGAKDAEYKYIEDPSSVKDGKAEKSNKTDKETTDLKGSDALDSFRKVLSGGEKTQKAQPERQGILAEPAKNTDLGTILGAITKGGVAGVKAIVSSGKSLLELDRELTAAAKAANGESKSAIMEALQKVREVMTSTEKLNPQESANRWNQ